MEQFLQRFLELKSQISGIVDVGAFWENIIVQYIELLVKVFE